MISKIGVHIKNEDADYMFRMNMSDLPSEKRNALDVLAKKEISAGKFINLHPVLKEYLFLDKESDNVLIVAMRYLTGDLRPKSKGFVDIIIRTKDDEDITLRLYNTAPASLKDPFMSVIKAMETKMKNPAVEFANKAKAGGYNDLSDAEYTKELNKVKRKAFYYDDRPEVPFIHLAINFAEPLLLCKEIPEYTVADAYRIHTIDGNLPKTDDSKFEEAKKAKDNIPVENVETGIADNNDSDEKKKKHKKKKSKNTYLRRDDVDVTAITSAYSALKKEAEKLKKEYEEGAENEVPTTPQEYDRVDSSVLDSFFMDYSSEYVDNVGNSHWARAADNFLRNVSFLQFYEEVSEYVIGHKDELKKACYYVYSYLRSAAYSHKDNVLRSNFIITGRSGCGKTEFYRALKEVFAKHNFDYNTMFINIASITNEGYKGVNLSTLMKGFYKYNSDGYGIIFFDEIDKKMFQNSKYNNLGWTIDDFLTMLDGDGIQISEKLYGDESATLYPTKRILFIGLGAFDMIRAEKEAGNKSFGFTELDDNEKLNIYIDNISADEMAEAGASQEFLGRFSDIINFKSLTEDDIRDILSQKINQEFVYPASAPINNIKICDNAMKKLMSMANDKRGIRSMVGKIRSIAAEAVIEAWCDETKCDKNLNINIMDIDPVIVKCTYPKNPSPKKRKKGE